MNYPFFKKNFTFIAILTLAIFVTILGLSLDLIEPDATLYGSISKIMCLNNDFINLFSQGQDWLDKPHLPFWLTAISFKFFGINNISYKIFGVLIFYFGAYITYQFTKKTYNKTTAIMAVIILITAEHSIISNFDVRAEAYLTGFIIAAFYWFYKYIENKKLKHLIIASLFSAFAVMTKGVFALIPIAAAIGGELLVKRKWKEIINPMWLVAMLLIFIFILPELYTLYLQFDLHPEKIVFGKTNVSGIKFFFWDSQFGRFFNTAPIKGKGDVFFFIHTILWAFLPWSLLFYIASFFKIKRNFKKIQKNEEFYTFFATFITLLIFSLSKFQLPHYSNIVFPFMAIITADFIYKLSSKYKQLKKAYAIILYSQMALVILLVMGISYFLQPAINYTFLIVLIFAVSLILYVVKQPNILKELSLFYVTSIIFLCINAFLITHLYPTIQQYVGGVYAAKFVNKNYDGNAFFIGGKNHHFAFEFYVKNPVNHIPYNKLSSNKGCIVYADKNLLNQLKKDEIKFTILKEFDNYSISRLQWNFINKKTRAKTLEKVYLLKLN
ncbi:ArnT family glycosyltransferase [Tenacibaculum sp. UWU-22]|uniref:ArnT family glycosyltransferase n=1 Tax=Tenacibaculum sp. UWU-22 TaxID=3234187 RepID=UPI0034DB3B75